MEATVSVCVDVRGLTPVDEQRAAAVASESDAVSDLAADDEALVTDAAYRLAFAGGNSVAFVDELAVSA